MKGVILAAGKGSRLYPITHHIAKPLLPLANKMTLAYAFDALKGMGIDEICVVVGENEGQMKAALGDGSKFGVKLSFVRQTEPKGLAHAVGFAQEFVGDDSFVLYLGDAIYDRGFGEIAARFRDSGCANLNLVKPVEDPRRFGVATVEGERIVRLVEKPQNPESNLAMAGMYFFGPALWKVLPDLQPSGRGEFEITDAIQMLIDRGETVLAAVYEGAWFDTGTLDSFLETSRFLAGDAPVVAGQLSGDASDHVVIGEGADVACGSITDSVVLPGAKVKVSGSIRRCIIAGNVDRDGDIENEIIYGE
ncbi:MAG: NTP transferase domain-containing protein [Armatimonadetes bacterium]|nr:NTP transferase domain-containing protein [Armatimonadota bacterium]